MVRLDSVGLRYGDGPEILKDVSFHLRPGSLCFLTGPSGAGKTSLLRLLFLALKPTRGIINIFEKDVSQVSRWELPLLRRRIGVVFQEFRLLDHLHHLLRVRSPPHRQTVSQRPTHLPAVCRGQSE